MKTEAAYLYNPQNQSEQELIDGFVIRQKQFQQVFEIIRNDKMEKPCQHFIVQGLRGTGKTTLLMRLYYEVMRTEGLNNWLIPIVFNEEQYGINRLYRLWYNIALELEDRSQNFSGIVTKMDDIENHDTFEDDYRAILFEALCAGDKKLVVFIDNIGDILKKLNKKELQTFREVLLTNSNIRVIAGSAVVLEGTYDYKQPFFEFFKIIGLKELNSTETIELLKKVDEGKDDQNLDHIIKNHPGRIEALRILTGGIPRTIVMLYEIFVNDRNGDSFRDLEILLDRVTPLYKHRMDSLPTQQQEIMDVIALNWDAISVKQIARVTKMESKAISAQLNVLLKNDLIIKKVTSTKNHLYQVKERFFNIWYIMRNGRRSDRNKVRWLVKFIEVWCTPDEVDGMANSFVEKIRSGNVYDKYAYHLAEAYSQKVSSAELQDEILRITKNYLENCKSDLSCQISDSDMEFVMKEIYPNLDKQNALARLKLLQERTSNTGVLEFVQGYIYLMLLEDIDNALSLYNISAEKGFTQAHFSLGVVYKEKNKDYEKAEKCFLKAIEKGDTDSLIELADLYFNNLNKIQLSKTYYLKAIEFGDDSSKANANFYLGIISQCNHKGDDDAEKYYRDSIELGNETAKAALLNLFIFNKEKKKAIDFSNELDSNREDNVCKLQIAFCWIWDNKIELAIGHLNEMLKELKFDDELLINVLKKVIHLLISKKQFNFVLKIFETRSELKDRFKPTYYALMILMKDQFPDEYLKMGSELEEPVIKVLDEIKKIEKVYV